MKFAILRATDSAVIGAVDAPAANGPGDLPELARGSYLAIDDVAYVFLQGTPIFDSYGIALFVENGGNIDNRPTQAKYWVVVAPDDTLVGAVFSQRGRTPNHPAAFRLLEVDKATHDMVDGDNQFFTESTIARWSVDGSDNVVENTDTRFNLEVGLSAADVPSGDPVTITLTLKNADGSTVGFSGTREMHVQHIVGGGVDTKVVRVTFAAGVATIANRVLALGTWAIVSHDSDLYRVSGDTTVRVSEDW